MKIVMDGTTYRLRVKFKTLGRSFRVEDGDNAGDMLSGLYKRDVIGTYYDYSMEVEPDPQYPGDYDNFFDAISAPVDSHSITVPYGQSTLTYTAMVTSGADVYQGKVAGVERWAGLQVQFTAQKPQREPTT